MKMHANEIETSVELVSSLIATQFPKWKHLPLTPFAAAGSSNKLYRLGKEMVVRMPRIPGAVAHIEKEWLWLPKLAPLLPLAIPTPVVQGEADATYPWAWSIHRWIEGHNFTFNHDGNAGEIARDLAAFISALHGIETSTTAHQTYAAGAHNSSRGSPLSLLDGTARRNINALNYAYDEGALTAEWEFALNTTVWQGAAVWVHGDLLAGNLLLQHGRLGAVIDFGLLGIGDPACDLMPAWCLFDIASRAIFRQRINTDAATWNRGRGWALLFGLMAVPYYENTNKALAQLGRTAIDAVLAENASGYQNRKTTNERCTAPGYPPFICTIMPEDALK